MVVWLVCCFAYNAVSEISVQTQLDQMCFDKFIGIFYFFKADMVEILGFVSIANWSHSEILSIKNSIALHHLECFTSMPYVEYLEGEKCLDL
jgi:hypothetical protein